MKPALSHYDSFASCFCPCHQLQNTAAPGDLKDAALWVQEESSCIFHGRLWHKSTNYTTKWATNSPLSHTPVSATEYKHRLHPLTLEYIDVTIHANDCTRSFQRCREKKPVATPMAACGIKKQLQYKPNGPLHLPLVMLLSLPPVSTRPFEALDMLGAGCACT